MTVKQLIEKLSEMPEFAEVEYHEPGWDMELMVNSVQLINELPLRVVLSPEED